MFIKTPYHSKPMIRQVLKINSVYQKLIPSPTEQELTQLTDDIKKHGIRNKIIVNQKYQIIDGYTRHRIGKQLKIKIPFEVKKFKNKQAELEFLISTNIVRRNLAPFQKVKAFIHIYQDLLNNQIHGKYGKRVRPVFSKMIGVSPTVLTKCMRILREGTPEQIKQVENNKASYEAIYRQISKSKSLSTTMMCPRCHGRGFIKATTDTITASTPPVALSPIGAKEIATTEI